MHRLFSLFGMLVFCFALGAAPLAYAKGDATAQSGAAPKAAPQVDATPQAMPKADAAAQADATAQSDAVARPATLSEVNSREGFLPEFPGRYFGMSPEEVVALEGTPVGSETDPSGPSWSAYKKELNGAPWLLVYLFDNEQLLMLDYDYVFYGYQLGQPLPFNKYQRWVAWLTSKYGPHVKHERFWGDNPDDKSQVMTARLESYYWKVQGITIQFIFYPPQAREDLPLRNNKPYMRILYYIED